LKPTLILHIGLERTGTTSFQHFCADHARRLREASILYPTRGLAYYGGDWRNHAPLACCYFHEHLRDLTVPFPADRKESVLASLSREVDSSGANVVLLSSEHFSSRMREPQIRALAADLSDYDCRVGVVVRDHVSRFFSSYSTHVVAGGVTTLDAYADGMIAPESLYFRYAETIRPWEEAFGKDNVGLFVHDRKGDALSATLERFAPAESKRLKLPSLSGYGDNFSYGPLFTEAFRRANLQATERSSWANSPRDWKRRRVINFLLQMWLRTTRTNPRAGLWALDESRMSRLKALAEADRQALIEQYGVRMPEESAPKAFNGELRNFSIEKFLTRADVFWRVSDAIEPMFDAARFTARTTQSARNALGI
jgi:hypothetical protein